MVNRTVRALMYAALGVGAASALVACAPGAIGGDDPAPSPNPQNLVFCDNVAAPALNCILPDFDVREKLEGCAGAGCHAGGDLPTDFEIDLSDPEVPTFDVLNDYLNEPATLCAQDLLIDAADPDCSFVLTKLTAQPKCGQRMPVSSEHQWSSDEIDCFRLWLHDNFAGL